MKMNKKKIDSGPVDDLVKQVLRDDLPRDVEARMIERFKRSGEDLIGTQRRRSMSAPTFWGRFFRAERRRRITWALGKEVLAMTALGLIAGGGFLHLSGRSGVLAESFSSMNALVSVSSEVGRVEAMSCTIAAPGEVGAVAYSLEWLSSGSGGSGAARVDVHKGDTTIRTLWALEGRIVLADYEKHTLSEGDGIENLDDPIFKPVMGFLSPGELSDCIYSRWRFIGQTPVPEGEIFTFLNHEDGVLWEMDLGSGAGLPSRVRKYRPDSTGGKDGGHLLMEVRFRWNEVVSPDSMVPGLETKSPDA